MLTEITLLALMSVLGTAECEHMLSGKVVDALTQEPIAQTQIESVAESVKTLTDDQGIFKLEGLCSNTPNIKLTKVGYVSKEHTDCCGNSLKSSC